MSDKPKPPVITRDDLPIPEQYVAPKQAKKPAPTKSARRGGKR